MHKNRKVGGKVKIDMTIIHIKMQVGNFSFHARKFRLAGLFVSRNNIHKKQRFVVKRAVFLVPKVTKLQSYT